MHPEGIARLQVVDDNLAVQSNPGLTLPGQLLKPKARAAEDSRAQALLKTDRKLDSDLSAKESMAMDHVALAGRDLQRQDLARQLGREGQKPWSAYSRVLRH